MGGVALGGVASIPMILDYDRDTNLTWQLLGPVLKVELLVGPTSAAVKSRGDMCLLGNLVSYCWWRKSCTT